MVEEALFRFQAENSADVEGAKMCHSHVTLQFYFQSFSLSFSSFFFFFFFLLNTASIGIWESRIRRGRCLNSAMFKIDENKFEANFWYLILNFGRKLFFFFFEKKREIDAAINKIQEFWKRDKINSINLSIWNRADLEWTSIFKFWFFSREGNSRYLIWINFVESNRNGKLFRNCWTNLELVSIAKLIFQ